MKKQVFTLLKGIAMGAADVVPGVSGGTIAFISGIYDELINTISGLDLSIIKHVKQNGLKATWQHYNLSFLTALFSGIAISILSLSKLITYALETEPILVWSFFFGLIIASILYIKKDIKKWTFKLILPLIIGIAVSYYITIAQPNATAIGYPYLFLSGFIAIIAMILPGVSGAFILLLMGTYTTVIETINTARDGLFKMDMDILGPALLKIGVFGLGAITGLKLFSKILKWLFKKHKELTLVVLIGFMIGSLNKVWPWKNVISTRLNSNDKEVPFLEESILPTHYSGEPKIFLAVLLAIFGFSILFALEKIAERIKK